MKTDNELLRLLFFEAMPATAAAAGSVSLSWRNGPWEDDDELRAAIALAEARGYLHTPEEVQAGTFWISLTESGRTLLPPDE